MTRLGVENVKDKNRFGVSVIVPVYNASATIADTLESVAGQTEPPLEVVVVDDKSTDETAAIARGFASRLPDLKVISLASNGGVARARNAGIRIARGSLIAPLDGDDIWHPTYLEKMTRKVAERGRCAIVYSWMRRIDLQGNALPSRSVYGVDGWGFYQLI